MCRRYSSIPSITHLSSTWNSLTISLHARTKRVCRKSGSRGLRECWCKLSMKAPISYVSLRVLSAASQCCADQAPRASPYSRLSLDGPMYHRFLRVLYRPVNVGPYSEDSFSALCSGRRLYLWCNAVHNLGLSFCQRSSPTCISILIMSGPCMQASLTPAFLQIYSGL
ncbi:hypothetical protein P692DRAFT_20197959 [Suillus brevipes Sb2]|nr:hypothetical protein P692DRAFT_20197959 [Suillus brevipes Sb2]